MLRFPQNVHKAMQLTIEPLSNLQTVRWRKPLWMPTAPSKVFRVPKRPVVPPVEADEMKRINNNYRTMMKSIRRYLTQQYELTTKQTIDPEILKTAFEEDFTKCNALNDEWNERIRIVREERYAKELEHDIELAKQKLAERQRINEEKFIQSEKVVQEIKAIADTFITRDNIDDAIEKAITAYVDYNFAIDSDGNKIIGRESKPETLKDIDKISIKQ